MNTLFGNTLFSWGATIIATSKYHHSTGQLLLSCVFFNQREHHPCILWAYPHPSGFKEKRRQKQGNTIHFLKFMFNCSTVPSVRSFTDNHAWVAGKGVDQWVSKIQVCRFFQLTTVERPLHVAAFCQLWNTANHKMKPRSFQRKQEVDMVQKMMIYRCWWVNPENLRASLE